MLMIIFKRSIIPYLFGILILGSVEGVLAQDVKSNESEITSEKRRIIILPTKGENEDDVKITDIIVSILANLGRFDVFDRNDLKNIFKEMALQQSGVHV